MFVCSSQCSGLFKCLLQLAMAWRPTMKAATVIEVQKYLAQVQCSGAQVQCLSAVLRNSAQLAILHWWPYCIGGHIASVAVLHQWLYHAWGHIASVTISHRWPYHIGGHIASMAILHRWSYCVCAHVRMHMHGCMHAAGMPVYAGGMRNIEYRTKLRRTAQEQLGFSISSSRSRLQYESQCGSRSCA